MKTIWLEVALTYDDALMHGDEPDSIEWFNRAVIGPEADLCLHENASLGDDVGKIVVLRVMDEPLHHTCRDLAAYHLGEIYKANPPSQEEADADMRTLTKQLEQTIDDWMDAKYDGERELPAGA